MAEEILLTKKTVREIIHMPWTPDSGEELTVLAKVDNIFPDCGWCYATCNDCDKQLVVNNSLYYCNICNSTSRAPTIRYRIHLNVSDESGEVIFTIFNKEAETLLLTPAVTLAAELGVLNSQIPKEVTNLVGKSFAFKIRLPDYFNPDFDFHHHRVVALLEIQKVPSLWICQMLKERFYAAKKNQVAPVETSFLVEDSPTAPVASVETAYSECQLETEAEVSSIEFSTNLG